MSEGKPVESLKGLHREVYDLCGELELLYFCEAEQLKEKVPQGDQEALRRVEALMRAAMEKLNDALAVMDPGEEWGEI